MIDDESGSVGERKSPTERIAGTARDMESHRRDIETTYRLAAEAAHANAEGCHGASLSIVRHRRAIETVAATNDLAVEADRLQYEIGEGPCLDELWEHHTVYSPDLRHDDRWPKWGLRAADETAVKSVAAFRVFTHGDALGVLNLYSEDLDAFDVVAREEGAAIAAHVAIAVACAHDVGDLTVGLDSRTIIGQATGILMGRLHLDADTAFKVLVRYSSTMELKLRNVSAEIVRTGVLPPLAAPRGKGDRS